MSNLRIVNNGVVGDTLVELDGVNIASALRGMRLAFPLGDVVSAELDVVVVDRSEVNVEADIWIPEESRNLLLSLGWIAPDGAGGDDARAVKSGHEPPETSVSA